MLKKFFIIFFLSTIFSTEIVLKDGKIFEGEIISQDKEKVIIQTSFGQLTFPTEDIITINFQTTQDTNIKTANTIDEKAENNTTLPPYSGYVEALGCKLGDQVGWEKGKYYCYDNQTWVGIDSPLLYLKSLGYKLGEECNREKGLLYSFKGGRWVEFWEEDFSSIAVKENSKNVMAFIGGINYSKIAGDDVKNVDNLMGFRFGVENEKNGYITGVTYSQRGYSDSYSDGDISINENYKINYITGYSLVRTPISPVIDLLFGLEFGYFWDGESTIECDDGNCSSYTTTINGDDWSDLDRNMIDYGVIIGGRIAMNEQISIVPTYYIGLSDWGEYAEFQNRSFQISISLAL